MAHGHEQNHGNNHGNSHHAHKDGHGHKQESTVYLAVSAFVLLLIWLVGRLPGDWPTVLRLFLGIGLAGFFATLWKGGDDHGHH